MVSDVGVSVTDTDTVTQDSGGVSESSDRLLPLGTKEESLATS